MLTKEDILYLKSYGISRENVADQIELLKKNYSYLELISAAIPGNGIFVPSEEEKEYYVNLFNERSKDFSVEKFVPASGAATRMFKRLINYFNDPAPFNFNEGGFYSVKTTFDEIEKFAFFDQLKQMGIELDKHKDIAEKILYSGLNYSHMPKGLIEFHRYPYGPRTAFEEHITEAERLCDSSGDIKIHFTISEEFHEKFIENLNQVRTVRNINNDISFSYQEKSTDTVAIYDDGTIVRNDKNNLLLRPGGHGSLLQNLNKLSSDLIFIKNIDNIIHGSLLNETIDYKKLLGGITINLIDKIKEIFNGIKDNDSPEFIENTIEFLNSNFKAGFNNNTNLSEIMDFVNRPLRVCGMVKNTGEPGGGPFWVLSGENKSLQIVEKSQINLSDERQTEILNNSTHFNPVDIVCYLKNPAGERFDLNKYVDMNASFISEKTYSGKKIRVIEHPGLWNGAMSDWLTIFVELPLITFNPVKELNDLLRKEHQPR